MNFSITFLHIPNQYETTRGFLYGLLDAAENIGIRAQLVSFDDPLEAVRRIRDFGSDLSCSFGLIDLGGYFLSDFSHVPHWQYWLDPAVFASSLNAEIVSFADRRDAEMRRACFLPHAVNPKETIPSRKTREAVFFGSFADSRFLEETTAVAEAVERIMNGDQSFDCALEGLSVEQAALVDLGLKLTSRLRLLSRCSEHLIDVFGAGWENLTSSMSHLRIHPPVSWPEAIAIMAESRYVLSSAPWQQEGTHERVLYGLLNESTVITTPSRYLKEEFGEDSGVVFDDDMGRLDKQDPTLGRAKVLLNHTWEQRLHKMQEYFRKWQQQQQQQAQQHLSAQGLCP